MGLALALTAVACSLSPPADSMSAGGAAPMPLLAQPRGALAQPTIPVPQAPATVGLAQQYVVSSPHPFVRWEVRPDGGAWALARFDNYGYVTVPSTLRAFSIRCVDTRTSAVMLDNHVTVEDCALTGDVNHDGRVTLEDLVILQSCLVGNASCGQATSAPLSRVPAAAPAILPQRPTILWSSNLQNLGLE